MAVLPHRSRRAAFTLVELLLVLVILGIVAAVVIPMTSRSLRGNQRRMAVRSVIGAAKYARSMAVLHQVPMVLRISGEGGRNLEVDLARAAVTPTNVPAPVEGVISSMSADGAGEAEPAGAGASAISVRLERKLMEKVRITAVSKGDGGEEPFDAEVGLFFDTNGRCTPFSVVIEDLAGEQVRVEVDHLGGARTEVVP